MISIVVISKDEPELDATLGGVAGAADAYGEPYEIVVVDASDGRLDGIAAAHPSVQWIAFERPAGVRVSIPHQRNAGVRAAKGDIVVFTDAGCRPREGWLDELLAPIHTDGEDIVAGVAVGPEGADGLYDTEALRRAEAAYLDECPTINLAFRTKVWEAIGGFDEAFEYGSDVDFAWRAIDAGHKIRSAPGSIVTHHWGDRRRQFKRSFAYGKARARLYRKHRSRRGQLLSKEPMVVVYPVFLAGLPVVLVLSPFVPWVLLYPALLAVPAWRNRRIGAGRVIVDHLAYGAGVLAELPSR